MTGSLDNYPWGYTPTFLGSLLCHLGIRKCPLCQWHDDEVAKIVEAP